MMTQKQAKGIIDRALAYAKGKVDDIEVSLSVEKATTSRCAKNSMTQNQTSYEAEVYLRVIVNGRQSFFTTNLTSAIAIRRIIDHLIAITQEQSKPDPGLTPMYAPKSRKKIVDSKSYDPATAKLGPKACAKAVDDIISVAKESKLEAAGVYRVSSEIMALGSSRKVFRFYEGTLVECSITMKGKNSTGWSKAERVSASMIDVLQLARIAANKAKASANPCAVRPGKYTVILEPAAVLDLICFLWEDFSGTAFEDQWSCFLGKLRKRVFGKNITITDDYTHPEQYGTSFDDEGMERKVITLVKDGILKRIVYGRRSATKRRVRATGHSLGEGMGEMPVNLVVAGGDTSIEDMIASTEDGLLVSRAWYTNETDSTRKVITGMTRDGTFLIKGGKIVSGVKNLRFNVSLFKMLRNVIALSPSHTTAGEMADWPCVVPAMKIKEFNFTSTSQF